MVTLTLHASGPRDIDDVWDRYTVPGRWWEWSPQVRSMTADADRLSLGVKGRVQPLLGLSVPFEVTEFDEAERCWTWAVRVSRISLHMTHSAEAIPDGSRTTLVMRGPTVMLVPYAPVAQVAISRLVR